MKRHQILWAVVILFSVFAAARTGPTSSGQEPDKAQIKVGILHSLSGTMAISESSLMDAELMAIEEINNAGGVLGRSIQAIVEDPESKFITGFREKAGKLVLNDKVAVLFGCWTSVSRKNILPIIEGNNTLLFYPVAYEGNECSNNVVYSGAVPNQQVIPAIEWLLGAKGGLKKRFYLVGSDYVYPHTANLIIDKYLRSKNIEPVAQSYTPFGHTGYGPIVKDIVSKKADVIISSINGDSNIPFFNELAAQGVTPDKTPVVSFFVGEDELRGLDTARLKGQLAAASYFQSIDTPNNKKFVAAFRAKYGRDRVVNAEVAAAYAQVYLWKLAVEKAGSFEVGKVRAALRMGIRFDAPEGPISIDVKNNHVRKAFRMGRVREDKQFDIIHETALIDPEPYPQVAFPGWGCDWTRLGATRGANVDFFPKR